MNKRFGDIGGVLPNGGGSLCAEGLFSQAGEAIVGGFEDERYMVSADRAVRSAAAARLAGMTADRAFDDSRQTS